VAIVLGFVSEEDQRAILAAGYNEARDADLHSFIGTDCQGDPVKGIYVSCAVTDLLVLEEPTPLQRATAVCDQLVYAYEHLEGEIDWQDLDDAYEAAKKALAVIRRP
jgi:hypothetical protein